MESFLGDLKKQMQCSLCKDTLIEPKLVQCFHVFCKLCIKRSAEVDQQDYIFKCPQCDSQTLLQDLNDVEDLQISPVHSRILKVLEFVDSQKICSVSSSHPEALWQCLDCDQSICQECFLSHSKFTKNHKVVALSDLNKQDIDKLLNREPLCKTHDNQSVVFYCHDCDMLICVLCLAEHHNHKTKALRDILPVEKDTMSEKIKQIEEMSVNQEDKKQQEEIALTIKRDGDNAKQQVKEFTEKLIKTLRNNEQQLLNKIQESITKAEKNLRIISHTTQAQEYIKYFMENGTASEMIEKRQDQSSQTFAYNPFDKTVSGIEFKSNKELYKQIKQYIIESVRVLKKSDPKRSSVKVLPSYKLEATKKAKLVFKLETSEGEVAQEPLEKVILQFSPGDDVKVGEIQMAENGEIAVEFTPRVSGELTADVQVHDEPLSNSPLVISVNPQKINIITQQSKLKDALNSGANKFTGIAVNKTNMIAVADSFSHCIRVFNLDGDLLLTHGSQGSGQKQFNNPQGLAFLNETDLVVVDSGNKRICILNTTSKQVVRTFGCDDNGNGRFTDYPSGVHVNDDFNIFVCYQSSSRVQMFTKDGAYLYHFSAPHPNDIMIHNGLFYVSDYDNSVVHVIEMKDSQSPSTITTIGGEGCPQDHLKNPRGLAIDKDGNLLVCCYSPARKDGYSGSRQSMWCNVCTFTLDGRYVGQSGQLANGPWYIAVLNDGQVICTTDGGGVLFLDN